MNENDVDSETLSHTEIYPVRKNIIAVDFDGVIHDYMKGWQDGAIYGEVTDGFWEWLHAVAPHYDVVVFSSRMVTGTHVIEVKDWLETQWQKWLTANKIVMPMPALRLSTSKPPAWVTIDDRAIRFDGDWSDKALSLKSINEFKPWMNRR